MKCASENPRALIDTLRVSLRIDDWDVVGSTATFRHHRSPTSTGTFLHAIPGGGSVWIVPAHRYARIEASAPRRAHGNNDRAASLAEAFEAIDDAIQEAEQFVKPSPGQSLESLPLFRIDLVRDFEPFASVDQVFRALSKTPRSRGEVATLILEPGAEYLRVGVRRSWSATLYNREKVRVAASAMRFEARLPRRFLDQKASLESAGRVQTLGDLTEEKLLALRAVAWERAGFGSAISPAGALYEALASSGLSVTEQAIAGWLILHPGYAEALSSNTRGKYRQIIRELSLVISDEGSANMRLDLGSGRLQEAR